MQNYIKKHEHDRSRRIPTCDLVKKLPAARRLPSVSGRPDGAASWRMQIVPSPWRRLERAAVAPRASAVPLRPSAVPLSSSRHRARLIQAYEPRLAAPSVPATRGAVLLDVAQRRLFASLGPARPNYAAADLAAAVSSSASAARRTPSPPAAAAAAAACRRPRSARSAPVCLARIEWFAPTGDAGPALLRTRGCSRRRSTGRAACRTRSSRRAGSPRPRRLGEALGALPVRRGQGSARRRRALGQPALRGAQDGPGRARVLRARRLHARLGEGRRRDAVGRARALAATRPTRSASASRTLLLLAARTWRARAAAALPVVPRLLAAARARPRPPPPPPPRARRRERSVDHPGNRASRSWRRSSRARCFYDIFAAAFPGTAATIAREADFFSAPPRRAPSCSAVASCRRRPRPARRRAAAVSSRRRTTDSSS